MNYQKIPLIVEAFDFSMVASIIQAIVSETERNLVFQIQQGLCLVMFFRINPLS